MAAAVVLIPGSPLGLITSAVQTLAGVLLPSATVFLLLLCNDRAVLGPWMNGRALNLFTGAVIATLVTLSIVLTASVLYPEITGGQILWIMGGGSVLAFVGFAITRLLGRAARLSTIPPRPAAAGDVKQSWRMPPLDTLAPVQLTLSTRVWMGVLRGYLVVAVAMVLVRVVQLAIG